MPRTPQSHDPPHPPILLSLSSHVTPRQGLPLATLAEITPSPTPWPRLVLPLAQGWLAGGPARTSLSYLVCCPHPTGTPGLCGQILACFARSHIPRDQHRVRDLLADGTHAWVLGQPAATPGDSLFLLPLRLQGHLKAQRLYRDSWTTLHQSGLHSTQTKHWSFCSVFHWKSNTRNRYQGL